MISLLSANHDEIVFSSPARLDIERAANKHLSFGYGYGYGYEPIFVWQTNSQRRKCGQFLLSVQNDSVALKWARRRNCCEQISNVGLRAIWGKGQGLADQIFS